MILPRRTLLQLDQLMGVLNYRWISLINYIRCSRLKSMRGKHINSAIMSLLAKTQ